MASRTSFGRILASFALVFAVAAPGQAAPITFTFNDLSDGSSNAAVGQSFAKGWAGTTVSAGAIGLNAYTGDAHAVGPGNGTVPYTLGTTDGGVLHSGAPDGFIANNSLGQFTITFPAKVYAVSFDFQIFPDGSGEAPDLTFSADGTQVFHLYGRQPGSSADPTGLVSGVSLVDTFPHSPFSGAGTEPVAQLLGSYTGFFPNGVQTLTFKDWPQTIGIDNLNVDPSAPIPNPEPTTALVWGATLAALGLVARRRAVRATPSAG